VRHETLAVEPVMTQKPEPYKASNPKYQRESSVERGDPELAISHRLFDYLNS